MPRHNWRTERPRKPKFGRMEAHHTGNQWTYFEVKKSKVKVTRPSNAHAVNVQYLPNGEAYELQTLFTDRARRPASATTFKVKGQGRKVTWCVWQVLVDRSRTKRPRKTKIGRKIVHPTSNNECCDRKCIISYEREGVRTSNLVHRRSTKNHISDKRCDLVARSRDASAPTTSTAMAIHKAYTVIFFTLARAYRVSRTRRPCNLLYLFAEFLDSDVSPLPMPFTVSLSYYCTVV